MSTSAITSSLLTAIANSPSDANRFATDLNQLAQDLQGGSLGGAQSDFVNLSQNALNGATASASPTSGITAGLLSAIAASPTTEDTFVSQLNQLGTDLQNGDLSSAQQDMLSLDSTLLSAASASNSSASANASNPATSTNSAGATALIKAIVQALSEGDSSTAGAAMQALASVSTSSAGASYLQSAAQSLTAGSGSAATNSVGQILQGLNPSNSTSALSLLA